MSHPTDAILVAFARSQLAPAKRGPVEEHVNACAACQERLSELQELWNALGAWELPPPGDIIARLDAAIDLQEGKKSRWFLDRPFVLRVAAAVVLAVGLGHWLAQQSSPQPLPRPAVQESAVAQSLHLDALDAQDRGLLAMVDDVEMGEMEGAAQ